MAAKQYSRRFTLDPTLTESRSSTLTLDDLQTFIDDHEEYNPRVRAVTFEVDDAVSDPS
ncbi:hypothetical protein ACFPYI_16150 [Halomarina salina]|uniref:Uncharacterized protein n=1 Tax=Halomarina salina TaxID=1872699 RepID=A0ABD5RRA8_9EURY|nr:hypothetical protein [Halomarina salina]